MSLRKLASAAVVELNHRKKCLMAMSGRLVQRNHEGHHRLSLLSTENKSLESVQPNLSRLNSSACYEFLAGCDKWVVLRSKDKGITTPAEFLWDPTTDEVRPLPKFQVNPFFPVEHSWHTFWGVGFDSGSGEYKVVRWSYLYNVRLEPSEVKGELLSVGADSWREIRSPSYIEDMEFLDYCIHINGLYYWPAFKSYENRAVVIPFDFGREEFPADLIPLPELRKFGFPKMVLAEYHGSLAVIFHGFPDSFRKIYETFKHTTYFRDISGEDSLRLHIWVWSNEDRSWSHLSTFHIPADADVTEVVGLHNNDKLILRDSKGGILLYDCGTSELESFGVIDDYKKDG